MIPFDQRTGTIWYDGAAVDWPDATLHVLSHGLHYASSVFEGLRVYGGVPFMLAEHVARLRASARILDFDSSTTTRPCAPPRSTWCGRPGSPRAMSG